MQSIDSTFSLSGAFLFSSCLSFCSLSNVATVWGNTGAAGRSRRKRPRLAPWSAQHLGYWPLSLRLLLGWLPHVSTPEGKYCSTRPTRLGRPICVQACFPSRANKFEHFFETTWTLAWTPSAQAMLLREYAGRRTFKSRCGQKRRPSRPAPGRCLEGKPRGPSRCATVDECTGTVSLNQFLTNRPGKSR